MLALTDAREIIFTSAHVASVRHGGGSPISQPFAMANFGGVRCDDWHKERWHDTQNANRDLELASPRMTPRGDSGTEARLLNRESTLATLY